MIADCKECGKGCVTCPNGEGDICCKCCSKCKGEN